MNTSIGYETQPQPVDFTPTYSASFARVKEIEEGIELSVSHLEEAFHRMTSREGELPMTTLIQQIMKARQTKDPFDAVLVVSAIEGLMNAERFFEAVEISQKEGRRK